MTFTLTFTEEQCVLLRNLIDLGLKQTGLQGARPLLALDDIIVAAGKADEVDLKANGREVAKDVKTIL